MNTTNSTTQYNTVRTGLHVRSACTAVLLICCNVFSAFAAKTVSRDELERDIAAVENLVARAETQATEARQLAKAGLMRPAQVAGVNALFLSDRATELQYNTTNKIERLALSLKYDRGAIKRNISARHDLAARRHTEVEDRAAELASGNVPHSERLVANYFGQREYIRARIRSGASDGTTLIEQLSALARVPIDLVTEKFITLENVARCRVESGTIYLPDGKAFSLVTTNVAANMPSQKPPTDLAAKALKNLEQKTSQLDQAVTQLRREQSNLVVGMTALPGHSPKTEPAPVNPGTASGRPNDIVPQIPSLVTTKEREMQWQQTKTGTSVSPSDPIKTLAVDRLSPGKPALAEAKTPDQPFTGSQTNQPTRVARPVQASATLAEPFSIPVPARRGTTNAMNSAPPTVAASQTVGRVHISPGTVTASPMFVSEKQDANQPVRSNAQGQSSASTESSPEVTTPAQVDTHDDSPSGGSRHLAPMLALAGTGVAALSALGLMALVRWNQRRFNVVIARIGPDGAATPTLLTLRPKVERIVLGEGAPRVEPADLPQAVLAAIVLDRFARATITADSARVLLGDQVVENSTARLQIGDQVRVHPDNEKTGTEMYVLREVTTAAGDDAEQVQAA